jgi:predicted RNA binding protein YcfA (HicA-like mRNA interferase family)
LKRLGFVEVRQTGSHLVLRRDQPPARAVVPVHAGRVLKLGTLRAILEEGGLSVDDLLGAL